MAGFKTHITVSSIVGAGYGGAAFWAYGLPLPTCVLAGGLCGVSGMLPDIDSDNSTPVRESMAFAAAVVPMMLLNRFQQLGMSNEAMVLAAVSVYLLIRFGFATLLKHYTVHRGMFHSIPAALVFGEIAYLLDVSDNEKSRLWKAGAVVLGYLTHLVLDEIYSIQFRRGRLRLKESFGTALKLFGHDHWANFTTYGKLILLSTLIFYDPQTDQTASKTKPQSVRQTVSQMIDSVFRR
jgi:hypothetical protein